MDRTNFFLNERAQDSAYFIDIEEKTRCQNYKPVQGITTEPNLLSIE
jgi:hypothetical protein